MKAFKIFVLAFLGGCVSCAADYYVSPDGNSGNPGTLAAPWPLQFAITNAATMTNGDTLWIRAGTYSGLFTTTIKSTASNAPVIIRNYNRERAVIDGQLFVGYSSTNVWFWGLEFIDSNKTNRINPFNTITGGGRGTKLINCLIHDCCIGSGSGESSGMQEAYGNVMWNVGKSSLEHGFYWQNEHADLTKIIEANIIGYTSGFGVHCYGSGGDLKNLNVLSNAVWVSSDKSDILMGGGQPVVNGIIRGNHTWTSGGRGIEIGYAGTQNSNAIVANNYVFAAYALRLSQPFDSLTVTNNIVSDPYAACVQAGSALDTTTADWDYNSYYGLGGAPWTGYFWFSNTTWYSWDEWKTATGYDSHSTYVSNVYAPDLVTLIPNRYEAKRANILVWNWTGLTHTNVDVSAILTPGDRYELRYAQNWFAGPVLSGTYQGGSVSVPLTNLPSAAEYLYWTDWTNYITRINTNLFAFVLMNSTPRMSIAGKLIFTP